MTILFLFVLIKIFVFFLAEGFAISPKNCQVDQPIFQVDIFIKLDHFRIFKIFTLRLLNGLAFSNNRFNIW